MIASITRPSNPKPWLEYLKRLFGSIAERRLQRRHQLLVVEIGPAVGEVSGVIAVAGEAGAVRQQLRDGRLRDLRVQALDVLSDGIVQPQFALFAQLHDSGSR